MKYWTIVTPDNDENSTPIYETLSEDEILEQYYPYWSGKMIEKFGLEEFNKNWSKKECIEDWVTIHWAWESDDLVYRLRKRAEIRRQIPTRKSVQEGEPDRIADLLEEAAIEIEKLRNSQSGNINV